MDSILGSPVESTKENTVQNPPEPTVTETVRPIKPSSVKKSALPQIPHFIPPFIQAQSPLFKKESNIKFISLNKKKNEPKKAQIEQIMLKDLDMMKINWTIRVRLIKKGEVRHYSKVLGGLENCLMPLEFIDEEGTQITATLFGKGLLKFMNELSVYKCYQITNVKIREADRKYTSIPHPYMLCLNQSSNLEETEEDPGIPYESLTFIRVAEIFKKPKNTTVDVLGIAFSISNITRVGLKNGVQINKRMFSLYLLFLL